jgi:hypothetical protein
VDPDRVSVPPGAYEMVRVSWCPLKPSRTVYCGTVHVVLGANTGGGGGRGLHSSTSQLNLSRFGDTSACPLSNRPWGNHAPNVPHKMCLR